jgi:hypothetical protein
MSAVSVLVMDCTITGAPPPTWILPTFTPTVLCRFCVMCIPLQRIGGSSRHSPRQGLTFA